MHFTESRMYVFNRITHLCIKESHMYALKNTHMRWRESHMYAFTKSHVDAFIRMTCGCI